MSKRSPKTIIDRVFEEFLAEQKAKLSPNTLRKYENIVDRAASKRSSAKPDAILEQIMAFNKAKGGGVLIRRQSKGYSVFREDTGQPVARLRPNW